MTISKHFLLPARSDEGLNLLPVILLFQLGKYKLGNGVDRLAYWAMMRRSITTELNLLFQRAGKIHIVGVFHFQYKVVVMAGFLYCQRLYWHLCFSPVIRSRFHAERK